MVRFRRGDRVRRRLIEQFGDGSPWRNGTVIGQSSERYPHVDDGQSRYYPEVYEVEWDDGQIEGGFLPRGLDKEP